MSALKDYLENTRANGLPPALAERIGNTSGATYAQLLKRPEVTIEDLVLVLRETMPEFFAAGGHGFSRGDAGNNNDGASAPAVSSSAVRNELKSVETEIKYAGYLQQQERAIERLKKAEQRSIPDWFDYASVSGLSREMKEKLQRVRPRTIAQASRIPGVTPAAVSLVNVYIEIQARRHQQASSLSTAD